MGTPKQVDLETRVKEEEIALSRKRRGVEEVLVGNSALEGEHDMGVDHKADPATEYKGYQALVDRAVDVFGDELTASRWLSTPSPDFDGDVPLRLAQELGYDFPRVQELFEPLFVRIEHGVYF